MVEIGLTTQGGVLNLPSRGDWFYTYTVQGDPLNPGWRLFLSIGTGPIEWDFVIAEDGMSASIKVEATEIANTFDGERFWLMLTIDPTPPDVTGELLTGVVSKP